MENQYNYYHSEEPKNDSSYSSQPNPEHHEKPKKKMPKAVVVTGCALLFGVVSSATFLTTNVVGNKVLGLDQKAAKEVSNTTQNKATLTKTSSVVTSDVSSVVESVMPSIVSITNMSVQQVQSFFGGTSQQEVTSAGTGIIIEKTDSELLIVTNNHVVADSNQLTVTFDDQSSVEADIKGTDSAHDLAVIAVQLDKISDDTLDKISVATLGDSTKLKVGEPAIAIGNALGYGQSVTTGVISATDRESQTTDSATGETTGSSDVKLIQTDAAINPGNSGGALVNANGEVIGINSAKLIGENVEGIGYAIPISDVTDIITNLMNQETKTKVSEAERGYLGITGLDVEDSDSQRYGMPTGVYISEVSRGGGAADAGITKGSIIVGFNGITIDSMESLQEQLQYYKKGEKVTLTLQVPGDGGEYQEQTVDVTLGSKAQ
ncbi:S1C family serine protease [Mediterraneibacter gnavus]|uniref:S1C family serine protease n=1 Tax=Mediterraneibacter gnavus TaxID=33038 RepID=UPI00156F594E|nr:trypsin-like peptidase domain-containing protein [Mediterraneibacter gnavus]NSC45864.1 trypsin-like serine protease [Mediterraneibacter gnavus]